MMMISMRFSKHCHQSLRGYQLLSIAWISRTQNRSALCDHDLHLPEKGITCIVRHSTSQETQGVTKMLVFATRGWCLCPSERCLAASKSIATPPSFTQCLCSDKPASREMRRVYCCKGLGKGRSELAAVIRARNRKDIRVDEQPELVRDSVYALGPDLIQSFAPFIYFLVQIRVDLACV